MKTYEFRYNGFTFRRVSKATAWKAYKNGLDVFVIPHNLAPFTGWHNECKLNRKFREGFVADEIGLKNDFESILNSAVYYNCINSETGKYLAFYIPVRTVNISTGEPTPLGTIEEYDHSFMEKR
jgi:hypothetical protein